MIYNAVRGFKVYSEGKTSSWCNVYSFLEERVTSSQLFTNSNSSNLKTFTHDWKRELAEGDCILVEVDTFEELEEYLKDYIFVEELKK
jgi:hypothetical protein